MFYRFLILSVFLSSFASLAQIEVEENYEKAFSKLEELNARYGFDHKDSEAFKVKYSGTLSESGHLSYPEEHVSYPIIFTISAANNRFFIDKELNYGGKTYYSKFLLADDSCYVKPYSSDKERINEESDEGFSRFYLPLNLIAEINSNKNSLHIISTENGADILGFNDKKGNKYYVYLNGSSLIKRVVQLKYHPIYGDTKKELLYEYQTSEVIDKSPQLIQEIENGFVKKELAFIAEIDTFSSSDSLRLQLDKKEKLSLKAKISCTSIAPNLYLLKLHEYGNKVLISEHDDFLSIYDAPGNIHVGRELIEYTEKRFKKPITHCFVSHHHPDHGGASVAFNAPNNTIITTRDNVPFFKKVSKVNHTICALPAPKTTSQPRYTVIDSLSNDTFFKKTDEEVRVYEIGALSFHTKEYLLFYFPKQKILFVPDLVFFPENKVRDQKERAYSVYEFIQREKLKVEKIYTGWPLKNYKDFGTMKDLKDALVKNFPSIK